MASVWAGHNPKRGEWLERQAEAHGLHSIEEFAAKVGATRQAASPWYEGAPIGRLEHRKAIAELFGTPPARWDEADKPVVEEARAVLNRITRELLDLTERAPTVREHLAGAAAETLKALAALARAHENPGDDPGQTGSGT